MSTGQPPTGKAPAGEKRSDSGQFPAQAGSGAEQSADKPASVPPASPELDSGWDASEKATSVARRAQGVVPVAPKMPSMPIATEPRPNPQSVAPNSSQARGKFTVGNLLSSAQGAGTMPAKNAQSVRPTQDHRRQISAVPQKPVERTSVPSPDAGKSAAERHDTPKGIGAVKVAPAPPLPTEPMVRRDTPKGIGVVKVAPAPPLPTEPMVRRDTPKGIGAVNIGATPAPSIEPAVRRDTPKGIGAVSLTPTPVQSVEPAAMPETPKGIGTAAAVGATPITAPSEAVAAAVAIASMPKAAELKAAPLQKSVSAAPAATSSVLTAAELVSKAAARKASQTSVSGAPSATFSRPKSTRQALKATPSQAPPAAGEVAHPPLSDATKVAQPDPSVNSPASAAKVTEKATSVHTPAPTAVSMASKPPAASATLDDPDSWDVAVDTAPVAMPPVAVAQPSEGSIRAQAAGTNKSTKATSKPVSERKPRTGKSQPSQAVAKRVAASQSKAPQSRKAGPESELSGEFFAATEPEVPHTEEFHETEEVVDERHMRSISPEAIARRAKFRVLVWVVFVGLLLLLAAAVARKYHLYNLHNLQKFLHLHKPLYLRKFF